MSNVGVTPSPPFIEITDLPSCPAEFTYNSSQGTYTPLYGTLDTLVKTGSNLVLTEPSGNLYEFTLPTGSGPYAAGLWSETILPGGQITKVAGWTTTLYGQQPAEVDYYASSTASNPYEADVYTYNPSSGVNAGLCGSIQYLDWNTAAGGLVYNKQVVYSYYSGQTDSNDEVLGLIDDLQSVTTQYASGTVVRGHGTPAYTGNDTYYFRYYTSSSSTGFANGLMYELQPADYYALTVARGLAGEAVSQQLITIDVGVSNANLAGYATYAFQYNRDCRVASETVDDELRTDTFAYAEGAANQPGSQDANLWTTETVEQVHAGATASGTLASTETFYTNYLGQTILDDLVDPVSLLHTYTYSEYNEYSDVVLEAPSSAITGYWDGQGATVGVYNGATSPSNYHIHLGLPATLASPVQEDYYYDVPTQNGTTAGLLQWSASSTG